ncbi:MAG: class I SAM-dependent methyltransferase [Terracidiphilus sp.]
MSQYDEFAVNYHWLYSDYVLSGNPALEQNDDVLRDAGPTARILDCSCGIGTFAVALAKVGYHVSGSDGSPGMIEQSQLAAGNAGVDVPLTCCTWEDLPDHFTDPFDLIFCLGNAIGHTQDGEEMLRSMQGMRAVLRSGGKLVLDSLNWERIRKEKARFTTYPWRQRAGQRCLPIYVWSFPERFEDAHTIEVLLVFDSDGNVTIRSYPIVYFPFRAEELVDCLRRAGFTNTQIQNRFSESRQDYRVIAS